MPALAKNVFTAKLTLRLVFFDEKLERIRWNSQKNYRMKSCAAPMVLGVGGIRRGSALIFREKNLL